MAVSIDAPARAARAPEVRRNALGAGVVAILVATSLARASGLAELDRVGEFLLVFTSIVIEALPFVLAGALVSALLSVIVSERTFARIGRAPVALQVPGAIACGMAFPVCECGSVPVAQRLIARGVHPRAGLAFMFAAPIVNPVVLASTWVAYSSVGLTTEMTAARAACGVLVAAVAGVALGGLVRGTRLPASPHHEHDHGTRVGAVAEHLAADGLFMARFLVVGAAVAAFLQTVVPAEMLSRFADSPLLGAAALMVLAVLLSLCSSSDAFVAVSFTAFTPGAQLAFLSLGPVLDGKLAVLYGATFRRAFVPLLVLVVAPLLLAAAVLFDLVVG